MVEIETQRLLLRRWQSEDLDPYAHLCADPEVMRYIGRGASLRRDKSGEQISHFIRHWEEKVTGAFIGFVGLVHQDEWTEGEHRTEVGWRLDRACWGRGHAIRRVRWRACVTDSRIWI